MRLGRTLHELWQLRRGVAISAVVALFVAVWSVQEISLFPPGLQARQLETATASTSVLVDTPRSTVLDTRADAGDFLSITNRALLIGNVMASTPVREYISRRAGVPASLIRVSSPVTPDWPRPLARPGQSQTTGDLLKSPDEFRLNVLSNPTVPEIDVYATAPSAQAAARLANGAVQGTQDYLRDLAIEQRIPASKRVRLQQLGVAEGGTINGGAGRGIAVFCFVLVFAAGCAATLVVARVRSGWRVGAGAMPHAPGTEA